MEINKNLYGDGSRQAHLRCETISCDKAESCSLYKDDKCTCVTVMFGVRCKYGNVSKVDGGTKQGKKYYLMQEKVKADALYHKLEYPSDCYIYKVDDIIVLAPTYVQIKDSEYGSGIVFDTPFFGTRPYYMPIESFTYEFLDRLCSYKPTSMSGGKITDYETKVVPFMLKQLKGILPDFYNEFIEQYPQYNVKPNYIGKRAYLSTVNQSSDCGYTDCHGNKFHFEDGYLVGTSSALMPFSAKNVELRVTITEDMTYTIDNNNQVLETTKFR